MAVKLADALVYLGVDDGGLAQGFDRASEKTKSWTVKLGGTATKLLGGVVVAGATAAAGAILGIGAAAFSVSSQIDTATKKARTQLGLSAEEAKAYGEAIKMVYARNVGESIEDVGQAIAAVRQGMHGLYQPSAEELGKLTEYAIGLRDAFDLDVNESVRAANQLVTQFGISGEEAFEIIAAGMQKGVNSADDLLDTLNEYAADFDDLGFTADQVLSTLNSGLDAGIYNTDKIGDAFREFKINMQDIGRVDTMRELNGEIADLMVAFSAGEITGVEAFDAIRKEMLKIQDPLKRQEIGVQLMGSLWEDLGGDAILAIDTLSDSLTKNADVLGSLQTQYQTLPQFFEGLKRRAGVALAPLGDKLLEIANNAMPILENAFTWLENELPGIVEGAAGFLDNLLKGAQDIYNLLFKGEFTGLFGLTEDDPIVGFLLDLRETVISLVTNAFGLLKAWFDQNWPTIQAVVVTAWTIIGDVFKTVRDIFVKEIWPELKGAFEEIKAAFGEMGGEGVDWGEVIGTVAKVVGTILITLVGIVTSVVSAIAHAIRALIETFRNMIGPIKGVIEGWVQFFTGFGEFFKRLFAGDFPGALEALGTAFGGLWKAAKNMVLLIWEAIKGTFNTIKAFVGGFIETFVGFFQRLYDRLVGHSIIPDLIAAMLGLFKSVDLFEIGKNMIQGLIRGIEAMRGWLRSKIQEIASNLPDWAKGPLGIHSESTVFAEIGKDSMGGLLKGITEMLPQVQAMLTGGMSRLALAGAAGMNVTVNQYGMQFPADPRIAGDGAYRTVQALKAKGLFGSL